VIGKTRVDGREGVVAQTAGKVVRRDQAPAITVHRPQYRLGRIVIRGAFAIHVCKLDTRAVRGAGETEECENACEDNGQLLGCAMTAHDLIARRVFGRVDCHAGFHAQTDWLGLCGDSGRRRRSKARRVCWTSCQDCGVR
jgi:hypothetical protein